MMEKEKKLFFYLPFHPVSVIRHYDSKHIDRKIGVYILL